MKKLYLILLLTLAGMSLAQTSGDHSARVRIPNYIGLKIVNGAGNLGNNPIVQFDYTTDIVTYAGVVQAGGGTLGPTGVVEFEDVQVASRTGNWYIFVRAAPTGGFATGSGFDLGDIRVERGSVSGLSPTSAISIMRTGWELRPTWRAIAFGASATRSWESLGFNGHDYTIQIDGDETPGEHSTTVTYLLFSP